ncbi:MAG: hypothetical protein H7831_17700, partial [Magnetococcus sp. WYHC-3]
GQTGALHIAVLDSSNEIYRVCDGAAGEKLPVLFDRPGTFTVVATLNGISLGSLIVHVVYVDFDGPVACQVGYKREKGVTMYGPTNQVFFTAKDSKLLEVSVKGPTSYGVRLYLKALKRGTPVVQARLGSKTGPILAEQEVDEFTVDSSAATHVVVNGATDTANTFLTMKPWIPNLVVNCSMYAHFSTFAGGATAYNLNTSDSGTVNVNGDPAVELVVDPATGETQAIIRVDFEIPTDEDSYCFKASFDQHSKYGTEVGCKTTNGKKCDFTPDPIKIWKGDLTPHVLVINERPVTGNNKHLPSHEHVMTPFKQGNVDDGLKFEIVPPSDKYNCLSDSQWKASVKLTVAAQAGDKLSADICGTKFENVILVLGVDLEIYNGLDGYSGGQLISETDEESKGAATVANLNDTDGDGTADKDDDNVSISGENPAGRNEIDLMKLVLKKPVPDLGDNVKLRLVSGDVKIWEKSTKETEVALTSGEKEFNTSDLDKTLWIEAQSVSTGLRDIVLELEYNGHKDTVKATGIWVIKTARTPWCVRQATSGFPGNPRIGPPLTPSGTSELPDCDEINIWNLINVTYIACDGSRYGEGTFAKRGINDVMIGGRILWEFEIMPHGASALGAVFDVTRQKERRYRQIAWGSGTLTSIPGLPDLDFPENQSPKKDNEMPTDDGDSSDEDNVPLNDHLYSFDAPSTSIRGGTEAFVITRVHFREWVRMRISGSFANNANGVVEGSRCSAKEDWHLLSYLKRDINGLCVKDADAISYCDPQLQWGGGITSDGTMVVSLLADAVTEGFNAVYDAANQKWTLTGTSGTPPVSVQKVGAIPAGTTWIITIGTKISVTITQGATAFGNGDSFTFSVFKTSASSGKKLEIKTGPINVTDGP